MNTAGLHRRALDACLDTPRDRFQQTHIVFVEFHIDDRRGGDQEGRDKGLVVAGFFQRFERRRQIGLRFVQAFLALREDFGEFVAGELRDLRSELDDEIRFTSFS